jgi:hypothetical protein
LRNSKVAFVATCPPRFPLLPLFFFSPVSPEFPYVTLFGPDKSRLFPSRRIEQQAASVSGIFCQGFVRVCGHKHHNHHPKHGPGTPKTQGEVSERLIELVSKASDLFP